MTTTLYAILYLLALVCFIVSAFNFVVSRFNLVALGLAFFVAVPFIQMLHRI